MILIAILSVVSAVVIWKLLQLISWYKELHGSVGKLPGTDGHWLLGHMSEMRTFSEYFDFTSKQMGENGRLCKVWFTHFSGLISAFHPDIVKMFLRTTDPKPITPQDYKFLTQWLGQGLIVSNGKKWDRDRKLITPAFHFNILKPYVKIFNEVADVLLNNMKKLGANGESFEVFKPSSLATLDSLLQCALSYKGEVQDMKKGEQHPYIFAVKRIVSLLMHRSLNIHLYPDYIFNMTSRGREMQEQCDFVHRFAENIIAERKKKLVDNPDILKQRHLDFLDILLAAKDSEGHGLTDQEVREQVDTFMFGGHDTTATATSWTLYALGQHPDLQEKVYQEVKEVLGDRKHVEWEDLTKLKYLQSFIKETMRMYPPVPSVVRQTCRPTEVEGVIIPQGVLVDINIYHLHHNPKVWENPWTFDPTRFDTEVNPEKDPYSFLPFVAGSRNCIGQNFAMNELKVFFARIIHRFRVIEAPEHKVIQEPDVVLRTKTGIWIKLTDREMSN